VEAWFPKVDDRWRKAEFRWADGMFATLPQYEHPARLPHDLVHYAVEAVLRPRYGFWELASAQAPFATLTPARPWPKDRMAWFASVLRKHRDAMVEAERLPALLEPEVDGSPLAWATARRLLERTWTDRRDNPRPELSPERFDAMRDLHQRLDEAWHALAMGERLTVSWPPRNRL
jgi:hypothetical protein